MAILFISGALVGTALFFLGYTTGRRGRERDDLLVRAIERLESPLRTLPIHPAVAPDAEYLPPDAARPLDPDPEPWLDVRLAP